MMNDNSDVNFQTMKFLTKASRIIMQGVLGDYDITNPQYILDDLYLSCDLLPSIVTKVFEMSSSLVKSVSGKNLS